MYQGKTEKSHPSFKFPSDWDIMYSPNHWSNETTMKDYVMKVLIPYVKNKREELKLPCDQQLSISDI